MCCRHRHSHLLALHVANSSDLFWLQHIMNIILSSDCLASCEPGFQTSWLTQGRKKTLGNEVLAFIENPLTKACLLVFSFPLSKWSLKQQHSQFNGKVWHVRKGNRSWRGPGCCLWHATHFHVTLRNYFTSLSFKLANCSHFPSDKADQNLSGT